MFNPIIESLAAKFSKKLLKISSFEEPNTPISHQCHKVPFSWRKQSPAYTWYKGTPIQGRQKAPSKRELLEERKPQHPLLFAAAAAAPKDSNTFRIGRVPSYHDGFATLPLERNAHLPAWIIKHIVTVLFRAISPISSLLRPRHEACPSFPACKTAYCFFAQCHLLARIKRFQESNLEARRFDSIRNFAPSFLPFFLVCVANGGQSVFFLR